MTIHKPRSTDTASARMRTRSGSRRATGTWQTPMPNPARMAASWARSLSVRSANAGRSSAGKRATMARTAGSAPVEPDQVMPGEILRRGRRPVSFQVAPMGMQPQGNGRQALGHQRFLDRLHHPHGDVGVALQQVVHGVGQDQFDDEAGVALAEARQDRWQVLDADHLAGADPHAAADARAGACGPQQRSRGGGQRLGVGLQVQRHLGRDQAALRAQEEVCADGSLQRIDMTGDRWLRHPELARCARQRPFVNDGQEGAVQGSSPAQCSSTSV